MRPHESRDDALWSEVVAAHQPDPAALAWAERDLQDHPTPAPLADDVLDRLVMHALWQTEVPGPPSRVRTSTRLVAAAALLLGLITVAAKLGSGVIRPSGNPYALEADFARAMTDIRKPGLEQAAFGKLDCHVHALIEAAKAAERDAATTAVASKVLAGLVAACDAKSPSSTSEVRATMEELLQTIADSRTSTEDRTTALHQAGILGANALAAMRSVHLAETRKQAAVDAMVRRLHDEIVAQPPATDAPGASRSPGTPTTPPAR